VTQFARIAKRKQWSITEKQVTYRIGLPDGL
jgi:hypothetical protein